MEDALRDAEEDPLTREQARILQLVALGWTDARIGRELGLSRTTVQRRLHSASERLGATSRINLVLLAVESGLIVSPTGVDRTASSAWEDEA